MSVQWGIGDRGRGEYSKFKSTPRNWNQFQKIIDIAQQITTFGVGLCMISVPKYGIHRYRKCG